MEKKKKLHIGTSIPRFVFVGLSVLFQVGWLVLTVLILNEHYAWMELITRVLSVIVILQMNSKHTNAAFKMPWIMLIMAFPVMGLSLYLMLVAFGDMGNTGKRMKAVRTDIHRMLAESGCAPEAVQKLSVPGAGISGYLQKHAGYPVYCNTSVRYFAQAADAFSSMKEALEKAESFIFMEYFIVSPDSSFEEICDILVRKARQGVDVRLMYDDMGSVRVNLLFAKKLKDAGVHCMVFNPAVPVLNLFMNHRDHRKITAIDGKVGYTGGYNLSDEYFDRTHPYGKWKDTGLRLEGEAVRSLTAAFLEMWNACSREKESAERYLNVFHSVPSAGFVQPYADDPLGQERVAENVYLNLIYSARESLYITTPYLIITDEMTNALAMAAKRGVDVRIITPGIPDKKTVYAVTRSYYAGLARQGVRIFEYTPGFCHAKQMLCDGKTASIGTSNLDYRSLYLHFENNVLLYDGEAAAQMAADFADIFPQCREVTDIYRSGRSATLRLKQYILRLFAPLM